MVAARERVLHELYAVFLCDPGAGVIRRDDGDLVRLDADVAQDQRQHALADAAEPDEDEATGKSHVNGIAGHDSLVCVLST